MSQQTPVLRFHRELQAMTHRADRQQQHPQIAQWPALGTLLREFSDFAKDYMSILEKTPETISRSPFAMNAGVRRLLQEWNVLSRACEQRLGLAEDATDRNGFQFNLREAGKLAKGYCDRWHPQRPVTAPYQVLSEPIVYFEKLYGITHAVYAPEIPVLSIPLTDYNDPMRWQALAHEVGHHVYWNGVDLESFEDVRQRLYDAIQAALPASTVAQDSEPPARARLWGGQWVEEVFADVCGTLFAGPLYAISAQDRAAGQINRIADLVESDHEHPCIYLRPLIALQVLREIASQGETFPPLKAVLMGKMLDGVEGRWNDFCRGASGMTHAGTKLTMAELEADVPLVVRAILDEPLWPPAEKGGKPKRLWDLVDYYGKQWADVDVESLEQMELSPLSPLPGEGLPDVKDDPPDIAISASFKRLFKGLKKRAKAAALDEEQRPLAFWSWLLGMDLSETNLYHVHGCSDSHWHFPFFWLQKHRHPQDGSKVIGC
jgi:hypothetical protein